jgi:dipeptidase
MVLSNSATNKQEESTMNQAISLLNYLEECGGSDRHEFYKSDNKLDMDAARDFAEKVRILYHDLVGDMVQVEQRNNIVKISLVKEAIPQ